MPLDRKSPVSSEYGGYSPFNLNVETGERARPPSFTETVGASFRLENEIGSYLASEASDMSTREYNQVDPEFEVTPDMLKGYEEHEDRLLDTYNPKAFEAVKADIDRETEDRKTRDAAGWLGTGTDFVAAMASPTLLLPGGTFVRGATVGFSGVKSAVSVGLASGAGAAVQEGILQDTQQTRTGMESALAIGGSIVLGGAIGAAGAQLFSRGEWAKFGKSIEEDLADVTPQSSEISQEIVRRMKDAGAAAPDEIDISDLEIGGGRVAQAVANATAAVRLNPGLELLTSPSVRARETFLRLAENHVATAGEMEGRTLGPAAETAIRRYQGNLAKFIATRRENYRAARKAGFKGRMADFDDAVARASRRNDVDPGGNEFVTKTAQSWRRDVADPLKDEAVNAKLLPEDVKVTTAPSYLYRVYNRQRILADEAEFRRILRDHFSTQAKSAVASVDRKSPDFIDESDMADYVDQIVDSVFNKIMGRAHDDVPDWIVPTTQGPLKGRTLNIPDEQIEPFLENNMELIARKYTKQMGAEVELTRSFGRADMADQLKEIADEYKELRAAAKSQKEIDKLDAREKHDIGNLEAFRDMARGTYRAGEEQSAWSAMTRLALAWNYIRLLGGVTLSSLPDAMNIMTRQGLRSFFNDGLPGLVSGTKAARIAKRDAREWGIITETVLQTRMAELAELNDPYAAGSVAERMMRNVTSTFSRLTFLDRWNDTMKTIVVLQTGNKVARLLRKGIRDVPDPLGTGTAGKQVAYEALEKGEVSYLGRIGIDEAMGTRIADQIQKFGVEENGITGLNLAKWQDADARRVMAAALSKEADGAVVTPGIADKPLWARSNAGKLAMQFKSFGLASHQRILIARLQGEPRYLAELMVFGTALGMMVSYLKFIERGDFEAAERLTENPGLWIADGFDRTGLAAVLMDVSNTAEKVGAPFGVRTAAQMLAGDEDRGADVSRYASRNVYGALFGPSAGLIGDLATIASQAANMDIDKQGARAIIRQAPFTTLPGIRTAVQTTIKPALEGATE